MSARSTLSLVEGTIDLASPRPSDVHWDSYAEMLAKQKRFFGATRGIEYSVAEHLCRGVDMILDDKTAGPELAAYFSLHDAPEAVLGDEATPKKVAFLEISQELFGEEFAAKVGLCHDTLTDRHDAAIHSAAGLPWPMPQRCGGWVKKFDRRMFVTEWRDLMADHMHPNPSYLAGIEPFADKIDPWPWTTAKQGLLRRWYRLLPALRPRADHQRESWEANVGDAY